MTYQVHLNGVAPGHDAAVVAAALAPAFKRPAAQVLAILNGPAIVLKRGLDRPTAEHYVAALTRAGCACSMHLPDAPAQIPARLAKVAWAVAHAGPPVLPSRSGPPADPGLAMAAAGQTLCIDAILLSIVFLFLYPAGGLAFTLCSIAIGALSVLGVVRIVRGLRFSLPACVFNAVAAMVPLINLVFLTVLSVMVARRVKQAGFKMGFLGVSARERARIRGAAPKLPHYNRWPSMAAVIALVFAWSYAPVSLEQWLLSGDGAQARNGGPGAAVQALPMPEPQPAPPPPVPAKLAPVAQFEARDVHHLAVAHDGTIYAGADRGFYRSINSGASWERLRDTDRYEFTVSPEGHLFLVNRGQVYRSIDRGDTFSKMGMAERPEAETYPREFTFFAGRLYAENDGLIVSADQGKTWRHIRKTTAGGPVHAAPDGTLYYGWHELFSSSDGGGSWNRIPIPENTSLPFMAVAADGTLVAASDEWSSDDEVLLWATRDKGKSWARADQGLPTRTGLKVMFLIGLADGSMMAAGSDGRIYHRAVGAPSWTEKARGLPGTKECALGEERIFRGMQTIAEAPDGRLYAGTRHGVFVSHDKGENWTPSLVFHTGF